MSAPVIRSPTYMEGGMREEFWQWLVLLTDAIGSGEQASVTSRLRLVGQCLDGARLCAEHQAQQLMSAGTVEYISHETSGWTCCGWFRKRNTAAFRP